MLLNRRRAFLSTGDRSGLFDVEGRTIDVEALLEVAAWMEVILLDPLDPLGMGRDGLVFDVGNGRVLKFCRSEPEAVLASLLLHGHLRSHDAVCRVDKVVSFDFGPHTWFAILREAAEDLPGPDDHPDGPEIHAFWDRLSYAVVNRSFDEVDLSLMPDDGPDFVSTLVGFERIGRDERFQVRDLHVANAGVTLDGRVVLRDFGRCNLLDGSLYDAGLDAIWWIGNLTPTPSVPALTAGAHVP